MENGIIGRDMEHVKNVCKIGQGSNCCKYLVAGGQGFQCMKVNPENKKLVEDNWDDTKSAQSDNCKGYGKEST